MIRTANKALASTHRVRLTAPVRDDEPEFIRVMTESRAFHHPWVTAPSNPEAWLRYLNPAAAGQRGGFPHPPRRRQRHLRRCQSQRHHLRSPLQRPT